MPTYYEVIKVDATAPVDTINVAIDEQYNQWRRLANHPEPNVVDEANRAMRQLEKIRTTLTDPAKRRDYDESLDVSGLVDPDAILAKIAATAPTPPPPSKANAPDLASVWPCPNCGKVNRVGSKVCPQCGHTLGRDCPNHCGNTLHMDEKFCSNCGANVQDALGRAQSEFEQAQKATIDEIRRKVQEKRAELSVLTTFLSSGPISGGVQEIERLIGERLPQASVNRALLAAFGLGWLGLALGSSTRSGVLALLLAIGFGAAAYWFVAESAKSKMKPPVENAIRQRQEYIRHAERRMQNEQEKQFDPVSPKPYS